LTLLTGIFLPVRFSYAADLTWTGAISGDWATGGNWSTGTVPTSADNVIIPDAATTANDPDISSGAVCYNLAIASGGVLNGNGQTISVYGNWTNNGTFNHGNGKVVFAGTSFPNAVFTPGSSTYYDIEINKTNHYGVYDNVSVSGTATLAHNLIQTEGEFVNGQFNIPTGTYVVPATADGTQGGYTTTIVNFNGSDDQTINYTAGGIGTNIRIDKPSGTFTVPADMIICSWTYVQGVVAGLDTHTLIFGDDNHGTFTPGNLVYSNIELRKSGTFDDFIVSGTATLTGNFIHTDGDFNGGQINLAAGDYIIGSGAAGVSSNSGVSATIMNFNGTSDQKIIYNAGGIGTSIRVDKTSGNLDVPDKVKLNGWEYVRGSVEGIDSRTMIITDDSMACSFIPGSLTYGNIEMIRTYHNGTYDDVRVGAGIVNMNGNLVLTEGQLILSANNSSINLAGDLTIGATGATFTKGTGTITFTGTAPSVFTDLSATPQNIGKVAVNKTNADVSQNKLTLSSSMACDTLNVYAGNTLDLGSEGYALILSNAGATADVFILEGDLLGTGIVRYAATNSSGNINLAAASYDDLEISGAETYVLARNADINGDLVTVAGSTFDTAGYDVYLAGNLTVGGNFNARTSAFVLDGADQSITGGVLFFDLIKEVSSSATLSFQAGSVTTVSHALTLKGGNRNNRLSLRSSVPDSSWELNVASSAAYDFDFLDVRDSTASRSLTVLNSLDSGNNLNWIIINNTAPALTVPVLSFQDGVLTITSTLSDIDHDNLSLKVEYSLDGTTWLDPYLTRTLATLGAPVITNTAEYQLSSISTSAANVLRILWDTTDEQNQGGRIEYSENLKIRLTPFDGRDYGASQISASFTVNNRSGGFLPIQKPELTGLEIVVREGTLVFKNLPENIKEVAVSSSPSFADASFQSLVFPVDISSFVGILYLKFRTAKGGTSDIITYDLDSYSGSSFLQEGDIVKTASSFDVYVIKYQNHKQYKRLILSPSVFSSYQHLKWENIKIVTQQQLDSYRTSNLVQVKGDGIIYQLSPSGDTGTRAILDPASSYDPDSVYEINSADRDSYLLVS